MALLHATQFYAGLVTSVYPTLTSLYTVPAGNRIIVRSVAVRDAPSGAAISFHFCVNSLVIWTVALAAGGSAEWRPWLVCPPGTVLKAAGTLSSGTDVVVSGSIYTI